MYHCTISQCIWHSRFVHSKDARLSEGERESAMNTSVFDLRVNLYFENRTETTSSTTESSSNDRKTGELTSLITALHWQFRIASLGQIAPQRYYVPLSHWAMRRFVQPNHKRWTHFQTTDEWFQYIVSWRIFDSIFSSCSLLYDIRWVYFFSFPLKLYTWFASNVIIYGWLR